jgi:riboflavin synthase
MFTGIISSTGTIESMEQRGDLRVIIACSFTADSLHIGDSVACNGACLTVANKGFLSTGKVYFAADISAETLSRTLSGHWEKGMQVNLERALKLGDALDGHMVTGHVDGIATLHTIIEQGDSHILKLEVPTGLSRFIAEKGSVTLNGVSLTVNRVEGSFFWVNVIPHTWNVTTLGTLKEGDGLNIEIDMIARYVARLMAPHD